MPKTKTIIAPLRSSAIALAALAAASSANAAEIYNKQGILLNFNAEVQALGAVSTEDYDAGATDRGNVAWTEGLLKLGFSGEVDIAKDWKVFGTITGIGNGTGGEGDAGGYADGGDGDIGLYEASGGIKFGDPEKGPSFKLSGGRQAVKIADGFIIGADVPTLGSHPTFAAPADRFDEGGAYYLNARKTFEQTAVLNVETGTPLRFDAFWLKSGKAVQGDTEIAGGNVEAVSSKWGKIGFMYTKIVDLDFPVFNFGNRQEDTDMFTVHGATSLGIPDFELAGNYTRQERDADATHLETDAEAWYLGATYKFSKVKYTPELMYRYSSFSGDDPNTAKLESFDPLFFGSLRWSTWFQGEIAANYTGPFNSNVDVHQIRLTANLTDSVVVGGIVNNFRLDHPDNATTLFGTTAPGTRTSKDFGTEINLYADFTVNKNLYISPLYGAMIHGDGLDQAWGKDNDVTHYFQLLAIYTY